MLAEQPGSMLDHALGYLAEGWSVFPVCRPIIGHKDRCEQHGSCKSAGKTPLVRWGTYQDRLPTKHEVGLWWHRWPTANIAMATGEVSGMVVIDLDGELAIRDAERRGLEPGPWARTGRVGGQHRLFAHRPDAPSIFAASGGIDFRGQGGYVVLPPSMHWSGTQYDWGELPERGEPLPALPRWIDEMASSATTNGHVASLEFSQLMEGIPEGQRDHTLFREAAKLRGAGVAYEVAVGVVQALATRCRPPFDAAEARAKVDSAYSRYEPNPPESPRLVIPEVDKPPGYRLYRLSSVMAGEERGQPQLVEGLLWKKRVHWTFADPGTGKTLWNLALHLHIAAGIPFCGREVKQGPVALIEEDSPLDTVHEYLETLADIYGIDLALIPFYMNDLQGLRLTDEAGIRAAQDAVAQCEQKPVGIILDAAERLVPSDKFNSRELDPFDRFLKSLVNQDIAPSVIDHTNRSGRAQDNGKKKSSKPKPLDMLYGGQSKQAISDILLYFDGSLRNGPVQVSWEKFRVSGGTPPPFSIRFDSDKGFTLTDHPLAPTSEAQQRIKDYLERVNDWQTKQDIQTATGLRDKTCQRALLALTTQRWIEGQGETSNRSWRIRSSTGGMFGS